MAEDNPKTEEIAPESPTTQGETPQAQPQTVVTPTNGLAVAALVTGIVAVISGWIPFWGLLVGVTAVVLGILGLRKPYGKGMSIAGLITGGIGALWGLLVAIFFVVAIVISATAADNFQQVADQESKDNHALTESKKDFAKGETATFAETFKVKINSVETNYNPGQYYKAGNGNQYIVVNVTIKNISDDAEFVSPYTFSVMSNRVTKATSYIPISDELESGELQPGASTTGNIAYEVKSDATDLKLSYETTVYDESYSSKRLVYTLAF